MPELHMTHDRAAAPLPTVQAHEESRNRLESLLTPGGMRDAAAKAVEEGRIDTERFGLNRQQALDALSARPSQLESVGVPPPALEAIIRLTGRPPMIVRNNTVVLEPLTDFPADTDAMIRNAEVYVPSTGRIEFMNFSMKWGGTGWVVDRNGSEYLIATNRHVAKLVARRAKNGTGVFMRSAVTGVRYGAAVDFNEEVDARPEDAREIPIAEITYLADDFSADVALLKIKKPSGVSWSIPDPIPLATREAAQEELVALVGYPAFDTRNDVTAMAKYFNDLYDVKRFAPGLLTTAFKEGIIAHDCTSLGGNSGSPLLSLEQKAAVGLHFAGRYGVENSAVSVTTLKALLKGGAVSVGAKLVQEMPDDEAADGVHTAEDLADRSGYIPDFLGKKFAVSWPALPEAMQRDLAAPSDATEDRPHELRYTHFGVKFSTSMMLPVVTAVNIEGGKSVRIKRSNDKWFFDARIPKAIQHGRQSYRDPQIDRGHMVRREDPNWGREAAQADGDTFHYTNSAPQHSDLNQGKSLWLGLENYVLESARTHGFKACVFTGPVFSEDDPELEEGIRVPLEFWKVVAMLDAERKRLHATAYLLSQGQMIRKLVEDRGRTEALEGFVLGEYRTFQIAIADLEEGTGYDFGVLRTADALARTQAGQEAIAAQQPVVVELETQADLIL